jgi:hypothetical protein
MFLGLMKDVRRVSLGEPTSRVTSPGELVDGDLVQLFACKTHVPEVGCAVNLDIEC